MARPGHLDQALGAAPALRAGAAPPSARGAAAAPARAAGRGPRRRHHGHDRRRGEPTAWSPRSICSSGWRAAPELAGWDGLGLAVQAYQKRALHGHRLARGPGAAASGAGSRCAWSRAPIGTPRSSAPRSRASTDYPVFTRKLATDVSYLACARRLLAGGDAFYPQFATHNAQTLASIVELAGERRAFEFQRLHGMGEALYDELRSGRRSERRLSRLRAGRQPRGPAALSRPPAARERRQHLLRQPHPRPGDPDREPGRGPGAPAGAARAAGQPARFRCRRRSMAPSRRNSRGVDLADPAELAARWRPGSRPTSRRASSPGPASAASGRAPRTSYDPSRSVAGDRQRDRGRRGRRSSTRVAPRSAAFPPGIGRRVEARARLPRARRRPVRGERCRS